MSEIFGDGLMVQTKIVKGEMVSVDDSRWSLIIDDAANAFDCLKRSLKCPINIKRAGICSESSIASSARDFPLLRSILCACSDFYSSLGGE